MNPFESVNQPEAEPSASFKVPVNESFLDPARTAELLPADLGSNEKLLAQIAERKELNENLDEVIDRIPRPDISFEDAIEQDKVTEGQIAKVYSSLGKVLQDDDYTRLALYVPFEFLPRKGWTQGSKGIISELEELA